MPRNKPRLQLGLYARPKHPVSPHYAFFIAPKSAVGPCSKHHVINTLHTDAAGDVSQPWRYEVVEIPDVEAEQRLLVRVIVAKITKPRDQIQRILEGVPVAGSHRTDADSFDCRTWVREAYEQLRKEEMVSVPFEKWEDVEEKALDYFHRKQEQGRWTGDWKGSSAVPLLDLFGGEDVFR